MTRALIQITGTVQGVGFRPFLFNLAKRLDLKGYVTNDTRGILVDIEGDKEVIQQFLHLIHDQKPPLSSASL